MHTPPKPEAGTGRATRPSTGRPGGLDRRPATAAFNEALHHNPVHAAALIGPAMLRRITSPHTPFDHPVGFGGSSAGEQTGGEATPVSKWIDGLARNLAMPANVDSEACASASRPLEFHRRVGGDRYDSITSARASSHFFSTPSPSSPPPPLPRASISAGVRPSTSRASASLVSVLVSHDALFGAGARRPGTSPGATSTGARPKSAAYTSSRGHGDFAGRPGFGGSPCPEFQGPHSSAFNSATRTSMSSGAFGGEHRSGYMLESEAAGALAARAAAAVATWARFTLKLTARRDHAIKLTLDGAERQSSRWGLAPD